MADIISLDKKHQLDKEKKATLIKKRKILAVQKIFQCTQCPFKCKKCGRQMGTRPVHEENHEEYKDLLNRLCESCYEEYIDYRERINNKEGDPDCYWHNQEWVELWEKWIDYQRAIDRYLKSEAFMQLLEELRHSMSEE